MKIQLENFKCWKKNEFHFENNSINLLNGMSGRGKSSILEAFNFAVTGEGKNIKTYQTKTCKVTVEYNNLRIVRTKTPNSLYVKVGSKEYHDDIAQKIVDSYFTKYFSSVSYISQGSRNSFFKMSPSQKLEFIENFALNISDKKDKIQEMIYQRKQFLSEITTSLQTTKELSKKMMKPDDMEFPVEIIEIIENDILHTIKIYVKKEGCLEKEVKSLEEKYKTLLSLKKEYREVTSRKNAISQQLEYTRSKLDEWCEKIESVSFDNNLIQEYSKCLEERSLRERQKTLHTEYVQVEKDIEKYKEQLSTIWTEQSKEELVESVQSLEEYIRYQDEVKKKTRQLSELEQKTKSMSTLPIEIETYEQKLATLKELYDTVCKMKHVYTCPKCSTYLHINGDVAEVYVKKVDTRENEATLQKQIKETEKVLKEKRQQLYDLTKITGQLDSLKSDIKRITEMYESMEDDVSETLHDYKTQLKDLEKKEIQAKTLLDKTTKRYEQLKKEIQMDLLNDAYYDYANIQECLSREQTNKKLHSQYTKEKANAEKELNRLEQEYESMEDVEYSEEEYEQTHQQYMSKQEEYKQIQRTNENIRTWAKNNEIREKYEEVEERIQELEQSEENAQMNYKNALLLKETVLIAESLYFQHFIKNFNQVLKRYLDMFFQAENDPMTLFIDTFKTGKTTKPQIDIKVFYKGYETDIESLSGGEQDRVNLAFTLAFSSMYNGTVLLLDECISSLDTENYTNVMDILSEQLKEKTIILVSHQANEGLFNNIINI
jgi:exonuclease SbcC